MAANERSYNNEQGLPVTVLGADDGIDVLVLEMGMRGFGEIARLCAIAPPTVGIVTAVAAAHTARLGGIDGVARAKGELVEALPADGVAILNADDDRVRSMARLTNARTVTFGESTEADVLSPASCSTSWPGPSFHVCSRRGVRPTSGWVRAVGTSPVTRQRRSPPPGRSVSTSKRRQPRWRRRNCRPAAWPSIVWPSGAVVIDDAYNANPTSMIAAFDALVAIPARRRIAVVGLMAELDEPETQLIDRSPNALPNWESS